MIVKGKILLRLFQKNGVTVQSVARELGMSESELARVLRGHNALGAEESRLVLAMFGAADMLRAIDWEAMHVRCPL